MPAPLAKGLVIAASLLVAASIAVYENPKVREWADQTRRKILASLFKNAEEAHPVAQYNEGELVAVEAARRKRDEIMRDRKEEFLRRQRKATAAAEKTADIAATNERGFDDFLQGNGSGAYTLKNEEGLKRRIAEKQTDDKSKSVDEDPEKELLFDRSLYASMETQKKPLSPSSSPPTLTRSSTATLPAYYPPQQLRESDLQMPVPAQHVSPASDDEDVEDEGQLIDLTPQTSAAPSIVSALSTPHNNDALSDMSSSSYFPTNESARVSTHGSEASLISLRDGHEQWQSATHGMHEGAGVPGLLVHGHPSTRSIAASGDGEMVSVRGDGDADGEDVLSVSDFDGEGHGGRSTPGSWTEVGSEVSEGDLGGR